MSLTILSAALTTWLGVQPAYAGTPPSNTSPPTISGVPQQGDVLTADPGAWSGDTPITYSYLWSDGTTGSTDLLGPGDVGLNLTVTVTASNASGQQPATSAGYGPVLPAPPVVTAAPSITGKAQQGQTLSAGNGMWTNNPTTYKYAWEDCNSAGTTCSPISAATSATYSPVAADVGQYVAVTVTASNAGGSGSVASASVGPVLPPAPVNTTPPQVTGTAEQGDTLTVNKEVWANAPTGYTYAWEECNASGGGCTPISGATSTSYALSAADVGSKIACVVTAKNAGGSTSATSNKTAVVVASPTPPASQPTTTAVLVSPTAPVTNQTVTLIATVSSATSSTDLWGTVTFADGGTPVGGCVGLPVTPSGQSATVACSTSFAASAAQISATFTPTAGSILKGSSGQVSLSIAPDSTSTSLTLPSSVTVGSGATYAAAVAPPAARPGPVEPTGSVEFLDGGQPIDSCLHQPLANGGATCTVTYTAPGAHAVTAQYLGDADFVGSSSPSELATAAADPPSGQSLLGPLGRITSTMRWTFYFTPSYTVVRNLVVNGAPTGSSVVVKCGGPGCPFVRHATQVTNGTRCGKKTKRACPAPGTFNLTPGFASRHLGVGARVTVMVMRANWVGKYYAFVVRARTGPRVQIGCLAPGVTGHVAPC